MVIKEEQFSKLAPQARNCMRLDTAIAVAFMVAVAVIVWLILVAEDIQMPLLVHLAFAAWCIAWIVYWFFSPAIRYRRYRYLIDEEKIVVREGLWFITQDFAPIERIHQIAVKSGPIDRVYGLAKVVATTAGGTVTIRFLEQEVAEEIAHSLQRTVRYILKQQGISVENIPLEDEAATVDKEADND